jgi:hypothetical protein
VINSESSQSGYQEFKRLGGLSTGAVALLAIAQENDRHKRIATNAALRISLEYVKRLQQLCARKDDQGVRQLLNGREIPEKWFEFCVASVDAIESKIQQSKDSGKSGFSVQTDFDRSVYMALGQTLSEVVREHRRSRLSLEVGSIEMMAALSQRSGLQVQELLIKNYVGNILQDLFDACKVRLTANGLARDTELKLREKDAELVARDVFAQAKEKSIMDEEGLLQLLRTVLAEIWQMDAGLE